MPKTVEDYQRIGAAQTEHRRIADEIFQETNRQLLKWGVQDHPAGNSPDKALLQHTDCNLDFRSGAELERIFRNRCETKAKDGTLTYFDILLEEVFEGGGAKTPEEFELEMIQVAAVAASAAAASRRARRA